MDAQTLSDIIVGDVKGQINGHDVDGSDDPRIVFLKPVNDAFHQTNAGATITAKTDTGSEYTIVLEPSEMGYVQANGLDYVYRVGSATFNGEQHSGEHVRVGFNWNTRTVLVLDIDRKKTIRRSSTIRQFTIVS